MVSAAEVPRTTPVITSGDVIERRTSLPPQTAAVAGTPASIAVTISGEITDTGVGPVTERGVVHGATPTFGATTTEAGNFSTGPYSITVSDLACGTTYHYANYATNIRGTSYGATRVFTTGECVAPLPAPLSITESKQDISTIVAVTAGATAAVAVGYAALYSTGAGRVISYVLLGLLAWLAYFRVAKSIREKKIGIIGTHNSYVIVGDALDEGAVDRVYRLKGRAPKSPYPILISSREELKKFGIVLNQKQEEILIKKYWPGPVNVVLPCTLSEFSYLHLGTDTLVFRFPADFLTLSLLRKTGPLIAPTANPEGLPPATTITEAMTYFKGEVDFFINKGTLESPPLTLVQLGAQGEVTVLYQGKEELKGIR
jgi:L-threonylcarbamoyladenylate synthase